MAGHEAGRGYATPRALEMAVKSAAERSPMDTGRAMSAFWLHRLLCRVFADGNDRFVLKGGRAMLARTIDARATRDIDLLARGNDLGEAIEELKALAAADLGDFVTFEFAGDAPDKGRGRVQEWAVCRVRPHARRETHAARLHRSRRRRGAA